MKPIQRIVIVGGGTAGWLAACYLQRTLGADARAGVSVHLIESSDIGIIGVGEATVPTLRNTLSALGIPESALFESVDASLKNGIRFAGWRTGGDAARDVYDHPFDAPMPFEGFPTTQHWLNLMQRGATTSAMADVSVVQTALFAQNQSPKLMHSPEYQAPVSYAYHLDAVRLAALLQQTAVSRGVRHTIGTVAKVQLNADGIERLELTDGQRIEGDLFVDCSGFAAVLIGRALRVPWVSFAEHLPCDRAVAYPVAHAAPNAPLRSYTVSTAQAAGWTWEIDLQSRRGTGYVYAAEHCSDDTALATLQQLNAGRTALAEPRVLKMRVGHHERMWEKNCLALGLAGGFIEPLESTAIYLIEYALQAFVDHLPAPGSGARSRKQFNGLMSDIYAELRDFVLLHYVLSQRRDTSFWRAVTNLDNVPGSLRDALALWDEKVPSPSDMQRRISLFGAHNWFFILAGLHCLPSCGSGQGRFIPPESSIRALEHVRAIREAACKQSPSMRDYAHKVRSAAAHRPAAVAA